VGGLGALALAVLGACSIGRGPRALPAAAAAALEREASGVAWDPATLLEADFTYDGVADLALGGRRGGGYVVGIVAGPPGAARAWVLEFPVAEGTQGGLCSPRVRLLVEEVTEEAFEGADRLPRGSRGLALHDDLCDAFHLYWDPQQKRFAWWRL
jgi:hypothetical protein